MTARAGLAILLVGALGALGVAAIPAGGAAKPSTCRGAAARDPGNPCFNATRSVSPTLAAADLQTASPCTPTTQKPEPICTFGVPASKARDHIALIGDSHALHWRAALDVVARAERWQGHSITAPGCFFSTAVEVMFVGAREMCVAWFDAARRWLAAHREIHTVFVSQNADTPIDVPAGESVTDRKVEGFRAAWSALPRNVRRVVVIRDTPASGPATLDCLERAIAAHDQRPGRACAFDRATAVGKDLAVSAVLRTRSPRYRYVDLTRFFCGSRACYPVIGGTLVWRDVYGHLTLEYARSLGPYLLDAVRRLLPRWRGRRG